jgi:DNA-binding NtrC family response regulator
METHNNIRIFLVDDDSFCINLYKQYLNSLGYFNITTFENGPDCLNSLSFKPDVIFLDHGMDYLTGLEVLKKIRACNQDIFVVFLTGQPSIMTAVKALRLGATEYIVKGIYDMDLIKKVLDNINKTISVKRSEIEAGYIDRLLHLAK